MTDACNGANDPGPASDAPAPPRCQFCHRREAEVVGGISRLSDGTWCCNYPCVELTPTPETTLPRKDGDICAQCGKMWFAPNHLPAFAAPATLDRFCACRAAPTPEASAEIVARVNREFTVQPEARAATEASYAHLNAAFPPPEASAPREDWCACSHSAFMHDETGRCIAILEGYSDRVVSCDCVKFRPAREASSAPTTEELFTDEHNRAIGKACEALWNSDPAHNPSSMPRPHDHPLHRIGVALLKAGNAANAEISRLRATVAALTAERDALQRQLHQQNQG